VVSAGDLVDRADAADRGITIPLQSASDELR
jgi:hypothetical protein